MDPYQQPAPQPGQYDFITNPSKPPKRSLFSPGKGNKTGMLIMVAIGVGVVTVVLLLASLLFGGSSDKDVLLNVAKKQSEVIAVATQGANDGGTSQAQSLGLAVQLSVTTQQQSMVAQITKNDKVKPKDYAASPSAEVTSQLKSAQVNGRFDEAFAAAIKQELTEYQQELRTANAAVASKSTKELLAKDFQNVGILLSIPTN